MSEAPYDTEGVLQALLASHPDLMPGELINSSVPRRWLLVTREASIAFDGDGGSRWSVDHLFLDQDGVPTLVEVKRSSDPRARREVVGQMLDYAASFIGSSADEIRLRLESACLARQESAEVELQGLLGPDFDIDTYWENVETNLRAGRVRMLFVADRISPELRRIVEFLNGQLISAEVLAVEVRQWVSDDGLKTLVPTVIGQTLNAEGSKGGGARTVGTRAKFEQYLKEYQEPGVIEGVHEVLAWCEANGARLGWGNGRTDTSCFLVWRSPGSTSDIWPLTIYPRYGTVEVVFQWLRSREPFDDESRRADLRDRMNGVAGVDLPQESLDRRPSFPVTVLANPEARSQLLAVLNWFRTEVESAQ